jgi:hypothetical protein
MSVKLTDTQLVLLSAAAQRKDRCLVASETLKGGAAQKVAKKLISVGLAKETKAKRNDPIWRRDEQSGASYALKLTAAGAKAIGIDQSIEPENAPREDGALENHDQSAGPSKVEGTHPTRWSLFLLAPTLHAAARSWCKSSNSFTGTMGRPSMS